jgi:hypothetical protein
LTDPNSSHQFSHLCKIYNFGVLLNKSKIIRIIESTLSYSLSKRRLNVEHIINETESEIDSFIRINCEGIEFLDEFLRDENRKKEFLKYYKNKELERIVSELVNEKVEGSRGKIAESWNNITQKITPILALFNQLSTLIKNVRDQGDNDLNSDVSAQF